MGVMWRGGMWEKYGDDQTEETKHLQFNGMKFAFGIVLSSKHSSMICCYHGHLSRKPLPPLENFQLRPPNVEHCND